MTDRFLVPAVAPVVTVQLRVNGVTPVVAPVSDLGARTNDAGITSMVKARIVEAGKVSPNYVKVVTERKVVYLLGIVSRQEGTDAAFIAATTSGVASVVKVFQYTD